MSRQQLHLFNDLRPNLISTNLYQGLPEYSFLLGSVHQFIRQSEHKIFCNIQTDRVTDSQTDILYKHVFRVFFPLKHVNPSTIGIRILLTNLILSCNKYKRIIKIFHKNIFRVLNKNMVLTYNFLLKVSGFDALVILITKVICNLQTEDVKIHFLDE